MKYLLVSPHLDDAVFSAGQMLAVHPGSTVLTIFAGVPTDHKLLTPYDEKMGFRTSVGAVRSRRNEDRQALGVLAAGSVNLDYPDSQYGEHTATRLIFDDVMTFAAEGRYDAVFGPAGMAHPDHVQTRFVMNLLARQLSVPVCVWADLPYSSIAPPAVASYVNSLAPVDWRSSGDLDLKRQACECYASQWGKYDITPETVLVPERYWKLA